MRRLFHKAQGLGFILWQSRHMMYHVLIGLVWAWILREIWNEFNWLWIGAAVVGSLLPDIEHIYYFLGYGKKHSYTQEVMGLIRKRQWRALFAFVATGHKYNTSLAFHNIYSLVALVVIGIFAFNVNSRFAVALVGGMASHYLFDIFDDMMQLGRVNKNWFRWGREKH